MSPSSGKTSVATAPPSVPASTPSTSKSESAVKTAAARLPAPHKKMASCQAWSPSVQGDEVHRQHLRPKRLVFRLGALERRGLQREGSLNLGGFPKHTRQGESVKKDNTSIQRRRLSSRIASCKRPPRRRPRSNRTSMRQPVVDRTDNWADLGLAPNDPGSVIITPLVTIEYTFLPRSKIGSTTCFLQKRRTISLVFLFLFLFFSVFVFGT